MNNMNPREKAIFAITMICLVVFIGYQFGAFENLENLGANSRVENRKKDFQDNLEELEEYLVVARKYRSLGQSPLDQGSDERPVTAFENFVYQLAEENGFKFPQFRSSAEDIEGAEEYEFLTVNIRTEGPFENTLNLLKDFERNGMLIREMDIRNTRDRDLIVSRVTVARVARKQDLQIAQSE